MLSATLIGLAALGLASIGFFVWCWLHFEDDERRHPIYSSQNRLGVKEVEIQTEERCA